MLDFQDDDGVSARLHELLDRWDRLRAAPPPWLRLAAGVLVLALVGTIGWRSLQPGPDATDVAGRIPIVGLDITTTSAEPRTVLVHVAGEVVAPGLVELPAGRRIADALDAAGGPSPDADLEGLNLAAPLVDGSQIRVGTIGERTPAVPTGTIGPSGATGGSGGGVGPIDLNRASAAELETLPGIGPATAEKILAWREASGPFRTVDDLLAVAGIGPAKLEAIRELVSVS